jgi:N-acetylglucosaminyldiphosphoundecaprenol N-acetyl-beta-D-mannosaminyltransferase
MKMKNPKINKIESMLKGRHKKNIWFYHGKNIFLKIFTFISLFISRVFEILISFLVLAIAGSVVLLYLVIRKIYLTENIFTKMDIVGYKGEKIKITYFNCKNYFFKNITLFYYVMVNKLSIVGVSVRQYSDVSRVVGDAYLYNNKPGIFSLWYIRQSARVLDAGQFGADWEYVFKRKIFTDILIILKSIPALFYYFDPSQCRSKVNIFDLKFDNLTMKTAIGIIENAILKGIKKRTYFVNPDCLNKIFEDTDYFSVLSNGDLVFPDGIGINIACKLLRDPLLENINGTDMLPHLCRLANEKNHSLFLLGGKPGVAEAMKSNLQLKYKNMRIVGVQDGYFDREKDSGIVVEKINNSKADILLVAFGAPLQEKWIDDNWNNINAVIQMGVGGLFDFYSGNIKRAPKWMREIGIEWVFRMMQEPRRLWKRYVIGNPLFIYRVLKWKFCRYKN